MEFQFVLEVLESAIKRSGQLFILIKLINIRMAKFFKSVFSFFVVYMLSFVIMKSNFIDSSPGVTTDGSDNFAAAFLAFFFSFLPAFMSGLLVFVNNPKPTTWGKDKLKRIGKISALISFVLISFYYYPMISSFAVYAFFAAYQFLMLFLIFAFIISVIYYLFGDMPIMRRIFSFLFLGGMIEFIDGIDAFSADVNPVPDTDMGAANSELEGAADSSGIGADGDGQIGNEGTPVDPDSDSEIEGLDLYGDGNIDVNIIGVEVPGTEHVDGHIRGDGTLVSPYIRSVADSVAVNNLEPGA